MFRNWRWQPFPLKRGACGAAKRDRTAIEFTAAPDKMKRIEFKGYQLFLDDAYRGDGAGPDGLPTGRFRLAGRDRELAESTGYKADAGPTARFAGLGAGDSRGPSFAREMGSFNARWGQTFLI